MPLLSMVTLTLTFKVVRASYQTSLPSEFDANPFSGSRDISHTNKKSLPKTTLCSSLRAVIMSNFSRISVFFVPKIIKIGSFFD